MSPDRATSARSAPAPAAVGSRSGGAAAGAALVLAALAAHVPLRIVAARLAVAGGARFRDHFIGGLASDLNVFLPVLALLWAVLVVLPLRVRRGVGTSAGRIVTAHLLLGLGLAALGFAGIAAAEFRVQRGLWPTPWDLGTAGGDAGFWEGALGTLGMSRYAWPAAASLLTIAVALCASARIHLRARRGLRSAPSALATLAVLAAAFAASRAAYKLADRGLFPTVGDRLFELRSPLRHFAEGLFPARGVALWQAAPGWLARTSFSPAKLRAGAAILGLPAGGIGRPGTPGALTFRRSFPAEERPVPALTVPALALSRALFAGRTAAPSVLEVVLESVRAADVNGARPAAPVALAPFLSALYRGDHGLPARSLSARVAVQPGVRTSHAIAGYLCGLGSLPFGWSAVRDLGRLPLRCLPDILADAGYANRLFQGTGLGFDRVDLFSRAHAIEPHGAESLPRAAERGAWGYTDRGLFRALLPQLCARDDRGPRFDIAFTVSDHQPYSPPHDMPDFVTRRVDAALAARGRPLAPEDRNRLLTLSYTDAALEEFLRAWYACGAGAGTIVVVHGDHATADFDPWTGPAGNPARHYLPAAAEIPLAILVPEQLLADAPDREAAGKALAALDRLLAARPLSGNDLPTLLLALLEEAEPLRRLEPGKRWHTMGGQATSPWFSAPGDPRGAVWGIDAVSRTFVLDEGGAPIGPRELVAPPTSAADVTSATSAIQPAAAVLRQLLADAPRADLP